MKFKKQIIGASLLSLGLLTGVSFVGSSPAQAKVIEEKTETTSVFTFLEIENVQSVWFIDDERKNIKLDFSQVESELSKFKENETYEVTYQLGDGDKRYVISLKKQVPLENIFTMQEDIIYYDVCGLKWMPNYGPAIVKDENGNNMKLEFDRYLGEVPNFKTGETYKVKYQVKKLESNENIYYIEAIEKV